MNRKKIMFSIIVVALNPGDKLKKTLTSILCQDYQNYEIVVKDGMSKDGSAEAAALEYAGEERLKICRKPDKSIYDAMNQALETARGAYILFLNCGDTFYADDVLSRTARIVDGSLSRRGNGAAGKTGGAETGKTGGAAAGDARPQLFYGNTFCEQTGTAVHSAPVITGFTCYRNIPCHQSCFYDRKLFQNRKYNLEYRIRADYDHFLWCFYRAGTQMHYMDMIVASYEGGGYSESRENLDRDRQEHRRITEEYMTRGELLRYRSVMLLTLAPLRRWMAENRALSGWYHRMKDILYGSGRKSAE